MSWIISEIAMWLTYMKTGVDMHESMSWNEGMNVLYYYAHYSDVVTLVVTVAIIAIVTMAVWHFAKNHFELVKDSNGNTWIEYHV